MHRSTRAQESPALFRAPVDHKAQPLRCVFLLLHPPFFHKVRCTKEPPHLEVLTVRGPFGTHHPFRTAGAEAVAFSPIDSFRSLGFSFKAAKARYSLFGSPAVAPVPNCSRHGRTFYPPATFKGYTSPN